MNNYGLLIFDFDGTLVDTAQDIALHANDVLKEFAAGPRSLESVKKAVGRGVHELLRELGIKEDEAALDKAVLSFKKRYWDRPVIHTRPYAGVRETLGGPLHEIPKAIVTNKPYPLTMKILRELSLDEYFRMVIGLDMQYPAKPDPTSVRHVMKQCGVGPSETLFVGDSSVDARTCVNAGIDFGWVNYGYDTPENAQTAAFIFSSPYEWKSFNYKSLHK